jgi:hypothetical protein
MHTIPMETRIDDAPYFRFCCSSSSRQALRGNAAAGEPLLLGRRPVPENGEELWQWRDLIRRVKVQNLQPVHTEHMPLAGGHRWDQGKAGGDVKTALAPAALRHSSMQVIHRERRGWASINKVWTCGPGSCSSAPLASVLSQSGAGLPRSLVATRLRRGVTNH